MSRPDNSQDDAPRSRRGRVSFSRVPHTTVWHHLMLQPLTIASNTALALWMYPSWRTARIRWNPPAEQLLRQVRESGRPIIYYSWHAYEPLTMLAFRDVPSDLKPTAIGHDGLLSRMLQRAGAWFGYHLWIYRRKSPVRPRDQIIDLVRTRHCNIGLFPDAGGPYGRIKPGIAEIAHATNALVVPMIARGRPILMLKWPWRYGFPLPFCSVVVFNGQPLDGRTTTLEECQTALEELERFSAADLEKR